MNITQLQLNLVNCLLRKILFILSAQNMNMISYFFSIKQKFLEKEDVHYRTRWAHEG